MLRIGYSSLSTKELDYLAEQTIILSHKNENKDVISNPVFEAIEAVHANYRAVVMKPTFSGLGASLREKDALRDSYFSSLEKIVSGMAVFDGSEKQQAAILLKKIFDNAGSVARMTYANQSVALEKAIEQLTTPESTNAITTLGINNEVDLFIGAQRDFNALYVEQIDANSDLRQQPSASSMRKELSETVRSYYALVSAMRTIEPWKDIYSDLTELLKKF